MTIYTINENYSTKLYWSPPNANTRVVTSGPVSGAEVKLNSSLHP